MRTTYKIKMFLGVFRKRWQNMILNTTQALKRRLKKIEKIQEQKGEKYLRIRIMDREDPTKVNYTIIAKLY